MPLTVGLAGMMDPATESAFQAAFDEANQRLGGGWRLLPEADAAHIVVDMDSLYGPMAWLRLHASGKSVIGMTSALRTQADFHLPRPFDGNTMTAVLREVGEASGYPLTDAGRAAAGTAGTTTAAEVVAEIAASTAAPAPAPDVPVQDTAETAPPATSTPAVAGNAEDATATPGASIDDPVIEEAASPIADDIAPPSEPEPQPEPEPAARTLFDWISGPSLPRRLRYARDGGPTLLVDAAAGTYHGPAALKPLAQYFDGPVERDDFDALDDAAWGREIAGAGAAQPLQRLLWLGALVVGKGRLLPGHDPDGRYQLNRWPQTEREYPRHFRIATAMMKAPATLPEIAAASGIPLEDVANFVNANLATGFASAVVEPEPGPPEPARAGGLLGRLRKR